MSSHVSCRKCHASFLHVDFLVLHNCNSHEKEDHNYASYATGGNVAGPPGQNLGGPLGQNVAVPPPQNLGGPPPQNLGGPPPQNVVGPPPQNLVGPPPQNDVVPPPQNVVGPLPLNLGGPPGQIVPGPPPQNIPGPPPQNVVVPQAQYRAVPGGPASAQNISGPFLIVQNPGGNLAYLTLPTPGRYPCSLCPVSRARNDDRRGHFDYFHKRIGKAHKCPLCGETFSRNGKLVDHLASVHGIFQKSKHDKNDRNDRNDKHDKPDKPYPNLLTCR